MRKGRACFNNLIISPLNIYVAQNIVTKEYNRDRVFFKYIANITKENNRDRFLIKNIVVVTKEYNRDRCFFQVNC